MTSTPAASDSAPHAAVAYILPALHSKRVQVFAADGTEQEADDNPWRRMELTDPFQQTQADGGNTGNVTAGGAAAAVAVGGPAEAPAGGAAAGATAQQQQQQAGEQVEEEEEEVPRPEEVIKSFTAAKGELEWLMAMLTTLQEGRYLTVGRSERGQDARQRMVDQAVGINSRYRRRASAASAASVALSEGAAALRALGQKQDAFYTQVAQLQRYWKLRQEPPDSPYAYSVNLNLDPPDIGSSSGSSDGSSAAAGPETAAMIGRGPVNVVYIIKDPAGMLRVQVPAPKTPDPPTVMFKGLEQPPEVYTGPSAIHALLLQQMRLNVWHRVVNSLDDEISHMLGLPSHLRPFLTAAQQQRQQQPFGTAPLAPPSQQQQQQEGSASRGGDSSSTQQPPPPQQQQQQQLARQQQQLPSFSASGHLTLLAALSSLVLQAVAGAAGTAGESALLLQQQQRHQGAAAAAAGDVAASAVSLDSSGPVSLGFLLEEEVDVGQPWHKAAAAAAARIDSSSSSRRANGSSGGGGDAGGGSNGGGGSSLVRGVCVDPQLLSMRALALEHLLTTQLGHLLSHMRFEALDRLMAPRTYAAAARQLQERARQRSELLQQQQQQQQQGRADDAGGSSAAAAAAAAVGQALRPGSYKFGHAVAFATCCCRWLAHAAHRDTLRAQVDSVLQQYPGIMARSLLTTHVCVSALQLLRSPLPAAGVGGVGAGLDVQQQRRQQQQAAVAAAMAAVAPSLLVLLTDWHLSIESSCGAGSAASAAAATDASGFSEGPDPWIGSTVQSAIGVQVQAVPRVLQQLLQQL